VRLPVHQVEKLSRLGRVRRDLAGSLGRDPSDEEVAEAMELPLEAVAELDTISRTPASLDALVGDDGGATLGDLVDASEPGPEELVVERAWLRALDDLIAALDPREADVIRSRFGLRQDNRRQTYDEIAARIGVSRERARQIEREALTRLRARVREAAS
jgi:RNA polymerase primary sigma factor